MVCSEDAWVIIITLIEALLRAENNRYEKFGTAIMPEPERVHKATSSILEIPFTGSSSSLPSTVIRVPVSLAKKVFLIITGICASNTG